jgi:hypothetical protein
MPAAMIALFQDETSKLKSKSPDPLLYRNIRGRCHETEQAVVGQFESVLKGRGFSRCGDVFFKLTHYRAGEFLFATFAVKISGASCL